MKFRPRAAVYQRLQFLIRYSDKFKEQIWMYHKRLNDEIPPFTYNPSVEGRYKTEIIESEGKKREIETDEPKYTQKELDEKKYEAEDKRNKQALIYAEEIAEHFCLCENEEEEKVIIGILEDMIRNSRLKENMNKKLGISFSKNGDLHIVIKAPVSKKELGDFWDEISARQRDFLSSSNPKTWEEHAEYFETIDSAILKIGKNDAKKKRFKELLAKKHEDQTSLTFDESAEYGELREEIYAKDLFKENPKEQLDDDLLILRISKASGSVKQGMEKYRKEKLLQHLRENVESFVETDSNLGFGELTSKYLSGSLKMNVDKRISIKEYEQRLKKVKDYWLIP